VLNDIGAISFSNTRLLAVLDTWFRCTDLDAENNRMLLLNGAAGKGKSTIVARLVAHPSVVAYHFCDFSNVDDTLNPAKFIVNIVRSLCRCFAEYKAWLQSNARIDKMLSDLDWGSTQISAKDAFKKCIVDGLKSVTNCYSKKVIMIDSMDEALLWNGQDSIFNILKLYKNHLPSWLSLFITSRRHDIIVNEFRTAEHLQMEDYDDPVDVIRYIESRVSVIVEELNFRGGVKPNILKFSLGELGLEISSFLSESDVRNWTSANRACYMMVKHKTPLSVHPQNVFVQRAFTAIEGNFLYGRALMDEVGKVCAGSSNATITTKWLPNGLGGLYLTNFERRFPYSEETLERYVHVSPLLAILVATERPLPQHQIISILEVCNSCPSRTDVLSSLEWLQSYLIKVKDSACPCHGNQLPSGGVMDCSCLISFAHQSIREWLLDSSQSGRFSIAISSGLVYISMWHLYVLSAASALTGTRLFKQWGQPILLFPWGSPCYKLKQVDLGFIHPHYRIGGASMSHIISTIRSVSAVLRCTLKSCTTCSSNYLEGGMHFETCQSCSALTQWYCECIRSAMAQPGESCGHIIFGLIKSRIDIPFLAELAVNRYPNRFAPSPNTDTQFLRTHIQVELWCRLCPSLVRELLMTAAYTGDGFLVEALLVCNPTLSVLRLDDTDAAEDSPLRRAIYKRHSNVVDIMLRLRPEIDITVPLCYGKSAIWIAACSQNVLRVMRLWKPAAFIGIEDLKLGHDVDDDGLADTPTVEDLVENMFTYRCDEGRYSLFVEDWTYEWRYYLNHSLTTALVNYFTNVRADSDIIDIGIGFECDDETIYPMHLISYFGATEIFEVLMTTTAVQILDFDFSISSNVTRYNILHWCAVGIGDESAGIIDILSTCLPVDIFDILLSGLDADGNTPLHLAAKNDRLELLKKLLRYSPNKCRILNSKGLYPICLSKTFECAVILFDHAKKLDLRDERNVGFLLHKPDIGPVTASFLIFHGARANIPYPDGSNIMDEVLYRKAECDIAFYIFLGKFS
jgi:hypothetical protein